MQIWIYSSLKIFLNIYAAMKHMTIIPIIAPIERLGAAMFFLYPD